MSDGNPAATILGNFESVVALHAGRHGDADHAAWVRAVKAYQAARFARSYRDLLAGGPYQPAARFFLDELYGPQDFSARDAQFVRVVPTLVRLFPEALVQTVGQLAELHALSEALDDAMARQCAADAALAAQSEASTAAASALAPQRLDDQTYARIWAATGQPQARRRQVELTLAIFDALAQHTRSRLLRTGLRAMRGPAQAAGLGELQHFLESGFDTFGAMRDVAPFRDRVQRGELALVAALFDPHAPQWLAQRRMGASNAVDSPPTADPLAALDQLPLEL